MNKNPVGIQRSWKENILIHTYKTTQNKSLITQWLNAVDIWSMSVSDPSFPYTWNSNVCMNESDFSASMNLYLVFYIYAMFFIRITQGKIRKFVFHSGEKNTSEQVENEALGHQYDT